MVPAEADPEATLREAEQHVATYTGRNWEGGRHFFTHIPACLWQTRGKQGGPQALRMCHLDLPMGLVIVNVTEDILQCTPPEMHNSHMPYMTSSGDCKLLVLHRTCQCLRLALESSGSCPCNLRLSSYEGHLGANMGCLRYGIDGVECLQGESVGEPRPVGGVQILLVCSVDVPAKLASC